MALNYRLVLENVSKKFGEFRLNNISFKVSKGEYFVVLGPSGAGKTLLLQVIAGIIMPDSGRILIDGVDSTRLPPEKRNVGYVPQNYALFPHLSVYDNIAFGLKIRKARREHISDKVREVSEKLGISHLLDRKVKSLSGGEAQRVALARALVVEPKILLLDEPLAAVDPVLRWSLRDYLREIHRMFKATVIHVTHDFTEAISLADRIAVLNNGSIEQIGTPQDVFYRPKSEFVAWFTRTENIYRGYAEPVGSGLSRVRVGSLEFTVCGEYRGWVVVSFRPEYVVVSRHKIRTSARNVIEGVLTDYMDEGALVLLKVMVNEKMVKAYITRSSFSEMKLRRGEKVYLYIKASQIHVIE